MNNVMEKMVFTSAQKNEIIEIKNVLIDSNIPITSIQLYIFIETIHRSRGNTYIDRRENRGILTFTIEEFDEELNDAQKFEIYTEDKYYDESIELINILKIIFIKIVFLGLIILMKQMLFMNI